MARYSEQQKAALDALMKDNVYEKAIAIMTGEDLKELTMDRLAKDVGVSRGTLYNYFADRDAVVDFVVDQTFEPLMTALEEVAESDLDPEAKLSKVIEWVFETLYRDRAVIVALVPAKQSGGDPEKRRARHCGFVGILARVIDEGIGGGVFRKLDSSLVSEFFGAAVRGFIDTMVETGEFHPADKLVPVFKELFLGGLRQT